MSFNSNRSSSQRHRSQSVATAATPEYSYQNTALAGPSSHSVSPHPEQQYQNFQDEYIHPGYSSNNHSKGHSPAVEDPSQSTYYSAAAGYYQRPGSSEDTIMMSQRDMNYGYMSAPIHNSMHNYPPGQPYQPQPLAPLPGYYADSQSHRNMSGSSRPNTQPLVDFPSFNSQERDSPLQSRKLRRISQSQSHEDRRLAKMRVRRDRLPGITNLSPTENHAVGGYVDVSPIAPSPSTYVQDSAARSHSRPSVSPSYEVSPGPPQYVSQPYHPSYSMGPVNPSNLAPPMSNPNYNSGRSSPMLQAPLPPAPIVSPHVEPVVLDRREKPQCWDHGCNGREFSTFSNLLRHQREKSGSAAKSYCPHCGAEFTRTTARNGHLEHGKCRARRTSTSNNEAQKDARR